MNNATGNEETGVLVLNLKCTLAAPPEEVFRMLTESTELRTWWGPHGFIIPTAELSFAEGGCYRFRMTPPDGEPFHLSGEFLEIDPPWRLVYTSAGRNGWPCTATAKPSRSRNCRRS